MDLTNAHQPMSNKDDVIISQSSAEGIVIKVVRERKLRQNKKSK